MLTPDQIRDARQRAGYSQAVLGKLVGVSGRTVGNWERGETSPVSYASKIRMVLRDHMGGADSEPARSLTGSSDAELLAEIARRLSRTIGESHDHTSRRPQELPDNVRQGRFRDAGEEQKIPEGIAAFDRELGDEIRPDQIPDD